MHAQAAPLGNGAVRPRAQSDARGESMEGAAMLLLRALVK